MFHCYLNYMSISHEICIDQRMKPLTKTCHIIDGAPTLRQSWMNPIELNMTSPLYGAIFAVSASVTHVCQEKAKVSFAANEGERVVFSGQMGTLGSRCMFGIIFVFISEWYQSWICLIFLLSTMVNHPLNHHLGKLCIIFCLVNDTNLHR